MNTVIVGAGRFGAALARRSVDLGYPTRVLCREAQSHTHRLIPAQVVLEPIDRARAGNADIILLAAPASADAQKEGLIEAFLGRLPAATVVCSAVAYAKAPHETWRKDRSYLRFMASPAVANLGYTPTVIVEDLNGSAWERLYDWFGRRNFHAASAQSFDRLSELFMATVIHIETVRQFVEELGPTAGTNEKRLLAATLHEAGALLEYFGHSPLDALDACSTPGGATETMVAKYHDVLRAAAVARTAG